MSNVSIIIASADPKIRDLARAASLAEGLDPILCGDGEEAIESIKTQYLTKNPIKLAVLEAFLPKTDGFEVTKSLKELFPNWEAPILMLLDRKGSQWRTNPSIRLNADDYLGKPFEIEEIQQKIHSMIKHFRAHAATHPISGLSGHPQMEEEVFARLNRGERFVILWVDINYFRPFNDHCGRERGNEVIRMMTQLIHKIIKSEQIPPEANPFLTHIDGDDFILLISEDHSEKIKQKLREEFQSEILKFYSEEEKKKGFFIQEGRDRKEQIFPLMNLSIVILKVTREKFIHYGDLVSQANEMLRQSKVGAQDVK